MVMRRDHPPHRPAAERPREQPLPDRPPAPRIEAGVDERPAVAVVERVDVDMVEPHRQRQPHPEHAVGDRDRLALARRLGEGEDRRRLARLRVARQAQDARSSA
jgi:hypothetical protein